MKKITTLSLLLLLTLLLFSCAKKEPDKSDGDGEVKNEYTVTFVMYTERITITYREGDIITPPTFPTYETSEFFVLFDGYDCTFLPVTEDATYKAKYHLEYKGYTATFVMGDVTSEVEAAYGTVASAPETVPDYHGMRFLMWDKAIRESTTDITYTAVYYDPSIASQEAFLTAIENELMHYSSVDGGDRGIDLLDRSTSLYLLSVQEYTNPQGGKIAERIIEHLTSIVTKDRAPNLDADTNWEYTPMLAGIALARVTPTVWENVPVDIQMRLQTLMRAIAYLGSFLTSDYNAYFTGPGMNGNYYKDWNPNYRLGNVPMMIYTTYFFGAGDMTLGAEIVNGYLTSFDEDAYTDIVNTFTKYGWRRAFKNWTTEGAGESTKNLLLYGGTAISKDGVSSTGSGVANLDGKTPRAYLYKSFALTECDKIIQHLINYNYGGQSMSHGSYEAKSYLTVKSEHWFDITGDGVQDLVAYIADDGISPYQNENGMMTEFASGNRSSLPYCTHDFVMSTVLLHSARTMKLYTTDENGVRTVKTDKNGAPAVLFDCTKNEAFFHRVQIGNEDMIYKGLRGYMSYATGIYGESHNLSRESRDKDYLITKSIWRTALLPLGTVRTAESYIN